MGDINDQSVRNYFLVHVWFFSRLIWKPPTEYIKFKRSILPTTDPIILMCRQMNRNKTFDKDAKIKSQMILK